MDKDLEATFGSPIFVYTLEDAIADGVLVDVSDAAHEVGFARGVRVVVTDHVWQECVAFPAKREMEPGRLRDVLLLVWTGMMFVADGSPDIPVRLQVTDRSGYVRSHELRVAAAQDPGGPLVLTVMFPEDD